MIFPSSSFGLGAVAAEWAYFPIGVSCHVFPNCEPHAGGFDGRFTCVRDQYAFIPSFRVTDRDYVAVKSTLTTALRYRGSQQEQLSSVMIR